MEQSDEKLITVFSTLNKGSFLIAKSILDSSGIQCFTKNEFPEQIDYGHGTQDILVNEKDKETARKLLKDVGENNPQYSFGEEQQEKVFVNFGIYASIVIAIIIILITVFAVSC